MPTATNPRSFRSRVVATALVVAASTLGTSIAPTPALAAGTPDIGLSAGTPGGVLYGAPIPVTLTATNPGGPDGFNLSFRDVLPVGVSYVPGSATPAPTIVPRGDGTTALVWTNVSDLLTGTTVSFGYQILPSTALYDVDAVISTTPGAYVNSDPRFVPDFDGNGNPIAGPSSYTGNDTDTTSTTLLPFEITKTEPNTEAELLRGVHDHQTVYTIRVDNNLVNPTTGFSIVDFLPAGLEFLGCGGVDNTTPGAEEYPGSGRIDAPGNAPALGNPCPIPSSVTTVTTDPDGAGPLPSDVYTRVEWAQAALVAALGSADLAPTGFFLFDYVAAIPLRENVQAPLVAPTANLDNNSGALTADEQQLENYAVATGTYNGRPTPSTDDDTFVVSAEDVSIHKSASTGSFVQGSPTTWTLLVENSEYAVSTGPITVTDTIPDGLDFVSSTPAQDGGFPVTNGDGTLTVQWTLPGFTIPSDDQTITFGTTTRTDYRATGAPVAANDSWTNTVDLATDATIVTDNGGGTTVLPVVDGSSAGQSAGGLSILKEVSEPAATLTCGDGTGVSFDPTLAGDYRPGDRVCWRLSIDFPGQLDTLDPVVQDFLPPGFAFDSWAVGAGDSGVAAASTFTDSSPVLSWNLGTDVDVAERFEVVVQSVITDPAVAADGDILSNLMKFRYENTDGSVFQLRDLADVSWVEPELTVNKGVIAVDAAPVGGAPADNLTVQNGEVVTFQVRVDNGGSITATSVDVRDDLPPGIDCGDISAISNGGTCDAVNTWVQWPAALGLTVPGGGSLALTYDLTVPIGTPAQSNLVNVAGVRTYDGPTNDPGNPTFEYVPSTNIDPTLEPGANTGPARDTSNVRTGTPTISKTRTTSITETGNNAGSQAAIGETITYTVTVNLPGGTAYYGPATISDVLSAGRLDLDETSLVVTLDGAALPAGFTTSTLSNTVTITFPGDAVTPYETPTDDPQTIVATFDAVVTDVATNVRSASIPNTGRFTYDDTTPGSPASITASINTTVVEPRLTLTKTEDDLDNIVDAGQTINYTVTVGNNTGSNVSTAHDVVVVDTVPAELIVLEAPGDPAEDGDTIAPDGGTWDATARTITWTVASIAPGASVALDYQVQTADPLLASGPLRNDAVATTTSLAGADPGERDGTTTVAGYRATASNTVVAPTLSIAKAASPATATVGQTVTYTLDVTIPGGVIAYDVTVIDDLPPGIAYESLTSVTCDQGGGACSPDISSASVTTDGDVVAFFLGDQTTAAAAARVVTITYVAYVDDVGAATAGATLTNAATAYFNGTDTIAGAPPTPPNPAGFDVASNTATDGVVVTEPSLTVDKDVAGQVGDTDNRRAKPGDTLTFTVTVTNASGATRSAAHDLTITDTPDTLLENYTPVSASPGVTPVDADATDGTLSWTFAGPLAPGASITITYTMDVPATLTSADEVVAGPEATNTADVPTYYGVSTTDRAADPGRTYRTYDAVDDTVSIELDLASIGDLVWYDVDDDGVRDPGEPPLPNVDVTVTYLGPNGVLGGGDDESVTVSTDANGNYLVDRLPGGQYLVDVDETDPQFVGGLTPSYDLDGGTTTPNGAWTGALGQAQDRRDVDFGYTGTGSIGDTIWFDQDGDGVQDAGEAGIPGVDVVVTWYGPDGAAGGGDDVVYPTATTDGSGNYLVDLLPAGNVSVTVQTGTVPTGYSVVSDPQGAVDGTSLVTLTAGEDDLDQDFGYRGSGSIGDTIYLDRDGDGVQDPGEPGLAGVTVSLDHAGPDGIPGNGDDSSFTTTTDASGNYLFEFLPPGGYTVTVTGGLPAGVTNSDDPDSAAPGDSTADLTLANGADDLDQDFGYAATSVLGDRVWWDLDRDGVQDPGEPGLNNVTVRATGPNGLTLTTVTSGDGDYLFPNIPDGDWTVAITSGLPAGLSPTFDADGTGTPGTSDVTLATSDLLQDFGYAGDSSVGDRIWLDLNGDGVQDAGEPGIEDITVELTWYGPNGIPGGGDDIVVSTSTDANGNYLFDGLPAGQYSVAVDEADPDFSPGIAATYDRDGTTVTPDGVTPVTLGASEAVTDVDFGYRGGGAIGDLVWFDRDGDGTQDADEPGLSGIDVTLVWYGEDGILGNADDETFTTTTDADGGYLFDGLPAGTFDVTVDAADLPAGMQPTFDADGGLDHTSRVVLADGDVDLDQDFGYNGAGSVGDTVYLDLDGNGDQDPGEPGIPGQTVTVTWAGPDGPVTFTAVTDGSGTYLVDGLPDGAVTVAVVGGISGAAANTGDPDGGADSTSTVTLIGGSSDLDQDFGYLGDNSIGDLVWWDRDADGALGAAETGLPGVEVTLTWFGVDGLPGGDDLDFVTTTAGDGTYGFAGLPDGSYRVAVTDGLPSGIDTATFDEDDGTSGPNGSTIVADLGVGDPSPVAHPTADFAFAGTGSIGDTVWLDLDGDGTPDAGEPGIPGVTITLTWAGLDGDLGTADDVVYPTVDTDADGTYLFEHLPAGEFRVDLAGVPAGLSASADPDGGAPGTSTLVLAPGEENLDQDFGYVGDASVGDLVWLDVDGDGVRDAGEPGLPGVTVTVTSPGSDGVLGTADDLVVETVTTADGTYLVAGLPGVTTTVAYDVGDLGAGLVPDSDRDAGDATVTTVDLDPGDAVRDVDYGVVGEASLTGTVFDDRDGDGVQDPGEPGIPGVDVTVVWNGPNGPVTLVVTTDGVGRWALTNLPSGEYDVTLDVSTLPDGDVTTTPVTVSVTVLAGGTGTVEHGATAGASIGDRVWNDRDRDGIQDAGEAGIPGVRVTLSTDGGTVIVATTTTDATGAYVFEDLTPGMYTVTVDTSTVPAGYTQTFDPDATRDGRTTITLLAGTDVTTVDFGYAPPRASVPVTGSDTSGQLRLALVALVAGLALVALAHRRRRERPALES